MSVGEVTGPVQGSVGRGGGLFVEGDASFTRTLTIGQVLKARILRHYEGGRYLADIDGRQKVVDSAIPLRAGDIVHGRVAALGDRVQLQRVAVEPAGQPAAAAPRRAPSAGPESALDALFARYQAAIGPADRSSLLQQVARARDPRTMALAALVLTKLGVRAAPEFLRGLYRVLDTAHAQEPLHDRAGAGRLVADRTGAHADSDAAVQALTALLEHPRLDAWRRAPARSDGTDASESRAQHPDTPVPAGGRETGADTPRDTGYSEWLLGQRLLNTQRDGSVSHRLTRFPLWFGDRLVEISMALFSQREASRGADGIRHRRLLLALDTQALGPVEIGVNLADRRLSLRVTTGQGAATERLARHAGELKAAVEARDWVVDEIDYATAAHRPGSAPVHAVVEHHIAQDSLSRLL